MNLFLTILPKFFTSSIVCISSTLGDLLYNSSASALNLSNISALFRLKAPNGEVIATGEGYSSKAACMNGIESVKKNAPKAKIEKV